ncbi:hypothetical protein KKB84_01650 [bacterium]|nr:hypothetical protein [bacterium]MBU1782451.1 hypothetical protein [bacterium]
MGLLRIFLRVIFLGVLGVVFLTTQGEVAETADIEVNVTLQTISVSVTSNGTWNMGMVGVGSTTTMTNNQKITILNDGNGSQTYTLQVTNTGGPWTASSTESNGQDKFVLSGVFSATADTGVVGANFNTGTNDDVIKSTDPKTATTENYAAETNATANGVSVSAGEARALWLQFKAPSSSTVNTQQTIAVTIGVIGG